MDNFKFVHDFSSDDRQRQMVNDRNEIRLFSMFLNIENIIWHNKNRSDFENKQDFEKNEILVL